MSTTWVDYHAQYAREVICDDLLTLRIHNGTLERVPVSDDDLDHLSTTLQLPELLDLRPGLGGLFSTEEKSFEAIKPHVGLIPHVKKVHVGIIGAGAAGLYAGLIIDSLEAPFFTYEILEANSETRKGGRLYTHKFPGGKANDYYDAGAMRFPDIPFMKPVFDLIRNPKSPIAGAVKLIPYVMDNPNNLNYFNKILKTDAQLKDDPNNRDPFKTRVELRDTTAKLNTKAIGDLKSRLKNDFHEGWKYLKQFDTYSTRAWMSLREDLKYTNEEINLLETFDTGTGMQNLALTESVIGSLTFDYESDTDKKVDWFCIQGGAGQLTDAMAAALTKKPTYDKVVNYIGLSRTIMIKNGKLEKKTVVRLKVEGEKAKSTGGGSPKEAVREYGHVISSIPFPCLRSVDTTQCGFDWNTQSAIRMLNYEPSVKVAIRFSDRWWEQAGPNNTPHDGGISRTDGPARIIVYPSYGRKEDNGATMIVSYTWAQDADRLGSLARGRDTDAEIRLLRLIVKDLADIHQLDFDELWKKKLDHHIVNWSADPYAGGAFAHFGPAEFQALYPAVTRPVGGVLHFAGEATSVHHAWAVGAFNSAWRAVYEILCYEELHDPDNRRGFWRYLKAIMRARWPVPEEFSSNIMDVQVKLGELYEIPTMDA